MGPLGNLLRFGRPVASTQCGLAKDEVVKCSGEQAAGRWYICAAARRPFTAAATWGSSSRQGA